MLSLGRLAPSAALSGAVAFASLASLAIGAGVAQAQGAGEQAAAEALFKQGRDLMAAGRLAEACPKLAESERLDPATGTLLNLATCYERNGQLASAWVTYKEAATASQKADQPERVQLARRKAAELEPKLPTLTIVVPPTADRADLQVRRDGDDVGRAEWGVPIPVDPGAHAIDATAAGRKPWHGQAAIEATSPPTSIEVPPLEVEPQAEATPLATPAAAATPPASLEPTPPPPPPSSGTAQRVVGIVVGGVGIAGIVVGAVLGESAKSDNNAANGHCLGNTACDPQGISLTTSAQHEATGSTIGFVAGGALLAGGVVLYLTAPSRRAQGGSLRLTPLVGAGATGVALRGGW